ncbi:GNAT family N-acetyltransferase [Oerskovia turbata]
MARSRVLSIVDLTEREIEAWRALAARAAEPNPYFSPELLAPAARELGGGENLRILVVDDGPAPGAPSRGDASPGGRAPSSDSPGAPERWWAVLPFEMVPGDKRWPWRHASTGSDLLALYCPLGTPLVDGERVDKAVDALVDALHERRREMGQAVDLHLVARDGPVDRRLREVCRGRGIPLHEWGSDPRGAVRFDEGEPGAWAERMPRGKSLARGRRRLERAVGATLVLEDRAAEPEIAKAFLDFEQQGWKGDAARGGMGFRGRRGGEAWFTQMLAGFSATGSAHVFALMAGGVLLHLAVIVCAGPTAFGFFDVYNEEWARYGPGAIGRMMALSWLDENTDVAAFDSSMNPSLYPDATALFPDRVVVASSTLVTGTFAARLVMRVLRGTARVVRRFR